MGQIFFVGLLILFVSTIFILNRKWGMLRDDRTNLNSTYSISIIQIAFWSNIIIAAFIATMFKRMAFPDINHSLLIMMGLTGSTQILSNVAEGKTSIASANSNGFWSDILNRGDMHRWQVVLVNLGVGIFFIYSVYTYLPDVTVTTDKVMPQIPDGILWFLGVSNGTYVACKATIEK